MHSWQIYRGPDGGLTAVKEGFNFWAFFFPGIWAFIHGLYAAGIISIAGVTFPSLLPEEQNVLAIILLFALMLVYGTLGNSWIISRLHHQQYRLLGTLKAPNQKAAELAARDFYTT